jgi:hypothetical protein
VQDYGIHLVQFWPVHDGMVGRMLMLLTCEHVQLSLNVAEFQCLHVDCTVALL